MLKLRIKSWAELYILYWHLLVIYGHRDPLLTLTQGQKKSHWNLILLKELVWAYMDKFIATDQ